MVYRRRTAIDGRKDTGILKSHEKKSQKQFFVFLHIVNNATVNMTECTQLANLLSIWTLFHDK